MAGLFDHIGSTAHHESSEFHPSSSLLPTKTHKNHLLDVWFSRPQTTASFLPLQPKVAPQHSALSFQPKATSAQQQYIIERS